MRTLSGRLGHSNAATTLGAYAHFVEESDRAAAATMGSILRASSLLGAKATVKKASAGQSWAACAPRLAFTGARRLGDSVRDDVMVRLCPDRGSASDTRVVCTDHTCRRSIGDRSLESS